MIFRLYTSDVRLIWAALWLFVLGNWVGQDYFAPQALGYFLDLVIVAVVLTWFRVAHPQSNRFASWLSTRGPEWRSIAWIYGLISPDEAPPRAAIPWQKACLILSCTGIFAFVAYSHQLTPFFLTASILGLVVVNRVSTRGLPVIFGVMTLAWVGYMTIPFLAGHMVSLFNEVGRLGETVGSNVVNRIEGSAAHQLIVAIRLVFTLGVWAMAGLGAIVRYRDGRRDLSLIVIAVAPFPLAALQAYGGELILRLYLFALRRPRSWSPVSSSAVRRAGRSRERLRGSFERPGWSPLLSSSPSSPRVTEMSGPTG